MSKTETVSQITKNPAFRTKIIPIGSFGPGLSSFMHILRLYTTTVVNMGSTIEEELRLQDIWTDVQGDSNTSYSTHKLLVCKKKSPKKKWIQKPFHLI